MNHATKKVVAAIHRTKERIKTSPLDNLIYGQLSGVGGSPPVATSELPAWTEIKTPTGRIQFEHRKVYNLYFSNEFFHQFD